MQASVFGAEGVLPALSRTLHLEPGILGERRLSVGNDSAAVCYDFFLAVFLFGNYFWFIGEAYFSNMFVLREGIFVEKCFRIVGVIFPNCCLCRLVLRMFILDTCCGQARIVGSRARHYTCNE